MARKQGQKESSNLVFHGKAVVAMDHSSQKNIKHLVSKVQEVVEKYSNHEIALVLQYYDYNVSNTIAAFTEDGAAAALKDWNYNRKKPTKANNKKKKKPNQKREVCNSSNDSVEKEDRASELSTGQPDKIQDSNPSNEESFPRPSEQPLPVLALRESNEDSTAKSNVVPNIVSADNNQPQNVNDVSNHCNTVQEKVASVDIHKPSVSQQPHKRNKSGSNRSRGPSESKEIPEKLSDSSHRTTYLGGKVTLEKSVKDLNRQTISLQRIEILLNEELDNSFKRLGSAFSEIHQKLNEREKEMLAELEIVKKETRNLLKHRQEIASHLKVQVDKAQIMNDQELTELKANIKHFVSERKLDEELGRTILFCRDSDRLIQEVNMFGEVAKVKNLYTTRRPTTPIKSNHIDASTSQDVPSNPTPVATEPAKPTPEVAAPTNFEVHGPGSSIVISSSSLSSSELAELQQRLQDSLKLQGISPDNLSNTTPWTSRSQFPRGGQSGANYRNQSSNNQHYGNWKRQYKPRDQPWPNSYRPFYNEGSGFRSRGPRPNSDYHGSSNNFDSEQKQPFGKRAARPKINIPNRSNSSQYDAKRQNTEHFNGFCEDENPKKQNSKDLNSATHDAPLSQNKKASKGFEHSDKKKLINGINHEMNGLTNMQNNISP